MLTSSEFWRNGSFLKSRPDTFSVTLTGRVLLPSSGVAYAFLSFAKVGLGFVLFPSALSPLLAWAKH